MIRELHLPKNWALTGATFHFVGEDFSSEKNPFAGTISSNLRIDAPAAGGVEGLAKADQLLLSASSPNFRIVKEGRVVAKQQPLEHLEFTFNDSVGRQLQQVVYYCKVGDDVYSVTGTHQAGAHFEKIRSQVLDVATELVTSK